MHRFATMSLPLKTRTALLLALLAGILSIALLALLASHSTVQGQESSLRANVTIWKSDAGVGELCIELRDAVAGETRQCPAARRLTFERAPQNRWLRSRAIHIAPEVSLWVRARLTGSRVDLGLGLSIEGVARGVRSRSWAFDWETIPLQRWVQTSTVILQLPVAPHAELWPPKLGIVAGAPRLETGKEAPEFKLPLLKGDGDATRSLSALRQGDEQLTLIVFWSSWAPFVGETLSVLGDLATRESNVLVIGINVYEVTDGAGEDFASNYGTNLVHLVDRDGSVAQHYRVDGVPELFVIDSDGVYRGVIRGAAPLTEILAVLYGIE